MLNNHCYNYNWVKTGHTYDIYDLYLMEMLGLKETVVQMAKVNGVRWYGHVLRRDVLSKSALKLIVIA